MVIRMKNKSLKVISNYIISIVVIALVIIILNYAFILYFTRFSSYVNEPNKIVKAIAEEMNGKNNKLSEDTMQIIKGNNLWVQLVNSNGKVIYGYNNPRDIQKYYSLKDIAKLSRNYLEDYPVFVWESGENLVILGYPKDSISKYNWFIPTNNKNSIPMTIVSIILLNVIIIILLSTCLGRIFSRPIAQLIDGIFSLKHEKDVVLKEKGIYKDLAQSINETSRSIMDKNGKNKLRDNAIKNWINAISHDVRTPLSMILGYSAMLEEDNTLSREACEGVKIITENSLRLREIIANLNLATSLQYNMQPLNLKHVKISNLVRKAIASSIKSGVLQNCSIEVVIEDEEEVVLIDEKLMIRAIMNIIINSATHNKNGCDVKVKVKEVKNNEPYVTIIISDNGCGISKDKIRNINEQKDINTLINKEHGLGLIIVKNIIESHNGKFTIKNGENAGVIVWIKIPKTS